jgi:hypothetical protein
MIKELHIRAKHTLKTRININKAKTGVKGSLKNQDILKSQDIQKCKETPNNLLINYKGYNLPIIS